MKDSSDESILDKPTPKCMAAITLRTIIINDNLPPFDGFEMAESFGIRTKKKTKDEDNEFPMKFPTLQKCKIKINRFRKN
jgi:hypothetical protein